MGLLLLVLTISETARCESFWWEKSKAQALNKKSFKRLVGKQKYVVIDFYSKGCYYCEKFSPDFNTVIEKMKALRDDFLFAKMDGEENSGLVEKYNVNGYPTIMIFFPGDTKYPQEYTKERDVDTLVEYLSVMPKVERHEPQEAELKLEIDKEAKRRVKMKKELEEVSYPSTID